MLASRKHFAQFWHVYKIIRFSTETHTRWRHYLTRSYPYTHEFYERRDAHKALACTRECTGGIRVWGINWQSLSQLSWRWRNLIRREGTCQDIDIATQQHMTPT